MSSVSASIKTRSAASASSRSSGVRREAELAKLRLLQQRQQSELERQLQDAERQQQNIERQLKEAALAQEVERLELEAELLEQDEAEVGEDEGVRDGDGDSGAQPSVAARRRPSSGPAPQPSRDSHETTHRTSRWVNSDEGRPPSPERIAIDNWIDRLDLPVVSEVGHRGRTWAPAATAPSPLPKLTLEKFRGDPLHWPRWSALFKSLVHDRRELSDAERLTHLQTCLEGPAQDAVSGLLCDGSLYGEALQELQQQFGDPTAVVRSSLKRVSRLPPVSARSPTQLVELSRALHAAVCVLRSFGYHADIAATTNVAAVVAKLPLAIAWKWGEVVVSRRPAQSTLEDLDSWLRSQALAARAVQAAGGEDGHQSGCDVTARGSSGGRDGNMRAAASDDATRSASVSALTSAPSVRCGCCGGSHGLDSCEEMADMGVADRLQLVTQARACYMCLTAGHVARYCELKRKCSVDGCRRFHHMLLHGAVMFDRSLPATVSQAPASVELHVGMVSATEVGLATVSGARAAPAARRSKIYRRLPSRRQQALATNRRPVSYCRDAFQVVDKLQAELAAETAEQREQTQKRVEKPSAMVLSPEESLRMFSVKNETEHRTAAALRAERGQLSDERLQRDTQLSELTGQLVGVTARMEALAGAKRALKQKVAALDVDLQRANQSLAERQQELEQLRSRAEAAENAARQLRDERNGQTQKVHPGEVLPTARSELQSTRQESEDGVGRTEELQLAGVELDRQVARAKHRNRQLATELAALHSTTYQLYTGLAELDAVGRPSR